MRSAIAISTCILLAAACGMRAARDRTDVRVFYASGFAPIMRAIESDALRSGDMRVLGEASGSQAACRKLTELGRSVDLLVLADSVLVAELLDGFASWRIDFATDELALGVGIRAPRASEVERDWSAALQAGDFRVGRVDENLGPVGYRTFMAFELEERRTARPGLARRLVDAADRVYDDVGTVAALLRSGELDYGFVYVSTCVANAMRYIELDPRVNLGDEGADYSTVSVSFERLASGRSETVTVRGGPVLWTLTIPDRDADFESAARLARRIMLDREALDLAGFRPLERPRFHGPREAYAPWADVAEYAGELK